MNAIADKTFFIIGINKGEYLPSCKSVIINDFETELFVRNEKSQKYFRMLTEGAFTMGYLEDLTVDEKDFIDAFKEHHEFGFVGYIELSNLNNISFRGGISIEGSEIVETNNLDIDKFTGCVNDNIKNNIIEQLSREKMFETIVKFDVPSLDQELPEIDCKFLVEVDADVKVNLESIANA